jgi:predicted TIM-barrel fold metal-dependent hydrolase
MSASSRGSVPPGDAPLIDCHAHVWGPDMPFAANAWKRPDYTYTVEHFLADLDAQGIRHGVIAAASLFGTNNAYSIAAVKQHSRLRATAIVDMDIDFEALAALRAVGIVGVRLQWFFMNPLPNMDSEEFLLLCNRLQQLDMHFHLNINGERLLGVAERLLGTGVKLVIDHFGWHDPAPRLEAPSYVGMLRLLERDNLWVKMTSGYRHPDEHHPDWSLAVAYAQDLLQRFGPSKLMWGSDAPFIGHEQVASYALAVERFKQCVPDAATRRAIGENGYRFYFGNSQ